MREREQNTPRNDQIHTVGCPGMVGLVSLCPRKCDMKRGNLESKETWGGEFDVEAKEDIVNADCMSRGRCTK